MIKVPIITSSTIKAKNLFFNLSANSKTEISLKKANRQAQIKRKVYFQYICYFKEEIEGEYHADVANTRQLPPSFLAMYIA